MNMLNASVVRNNGSLRMVNDTRTLDLAVHAAHVDALSRYEGKKVTLGIRPEDLVENRAQTCEAGKSIAATVEVVEPMGAEIYLYLNVGGQTITARVKSDREPEVNKPYIIDAVMDKAHYFDADTEKAIV